MKNTRKRTGKTFSKVTKAQIETFERAYYERYNSVFHSGKQIITINTTLTG